MTALYCLQTFYMYNMSQAMAFWIVSALIFPLSQVSETGLTVTNTFVALHSVGQPRHASGCRTTSVLLCGRQRLHDANVCLQMEGEDAGFKSSPQSCRMHLLQTVMPAISF